MSLKDEWKKVGKGFGKVGKDIGHVGATLGKTVVNTVAQGVNSAAEWANEEERASAAPTEVEATVVEESKAE